jgi:hypothetical protein
MPGRGIVKESGTLPSPFEVFAAGSHPLMELGPFLTIPLAVGSPPTKT